MNCIVCDVILGGGKNWAFISNKEKKIPYCSERCRDKYYRDMGKEKTQDLIKKELLKD